MWQLKVTNNDGEYDDDEEEEDDDDDDDDNDDDDDDNDDDEPPSRRALPFLHFQSTQAPHPPWQGFWQHSPPDNHDHDYDYYDGYDHCL